MSVGFLLLFCGLTVGLHTSFAYIFIFLAADSLCEVINVTAHSYPLVFVFTVSVDET